MPTGRHRFPKSLRYQVVHLLQAVRAIGRTKQEAPLDIRSLATWQIYKEELIRLADFLKPGGFASFLDPAATYAGVARYLVDYLEHLSRRGCSLQTLERTLAALGMLERAVNRYGELHGLGLPPLETGELRSSCHRRAVELLPRYSTSYGNRAYPDPQALIAALPDETYALMARLQLEGGLRCCGAGAPSRVRLANPVSAQSLRGVLPDPVTGARVGSLATREKGGKVTQHYVALATYRELERYLERFGELCADYFGYLAALNRAARATGQHAPGRGSHGLKHNFAQARYLQCVDAGWSQQRSLRQVSLECSHFRLKEALAYTQGRGG